MKKKNIKPLVLSSLAALSLGSMSVAGTFALFTDTAETTINIGAAEVNVKNAMTIVDAYSLNQQDANTHTTKEAHYVNGGEVEVTDNTAGETTQIDVVNWTPGDGVKLRTAPTNSSNVTIKVRLKAVMSGLLAPALVMEVRNAEATGDALYAAKGSRTLVSDWVEVDPGENPAAFDLDIKFPNHGFEITAREEGIDNQYQGKPATIKISYEAVQGNADVSSSLLEKINTRLATNEVNDGKNANMYEAVNDLAGVATLAQLKANDYVWGADEDLFYEAAGVTSGQEYKYFKVFDSMPDTQSFSVYASDSWSGETVSLTGIGFDAGDILNISSVSYVGIAETPRENIIRTNGGSLSINAALDTIHHYGDADSLNIIAVAGNSYHENGSVLLAEVKTGRIVLEKDSEVKQVHLAATDGVFNNIIVAKDSTVEMPDFSRDPVEIPEEGKLVVALQDGTEVDDDKDYVWLTAIGIYEQVVVSDQKESLSAEDAKNSYAAESDDQEKKVTAQQIANNIKATVDENEYTLTATTTDGGQTWNYSLESEAVEDITENVTVAVAENVTTVSVAGEEKATVTENGLTEAQIEAIVEEIGKGVAKIGSVRYDDLQKALDAVEDGQTIVVLKDIQLAGNLSKSAFTTTANRTFTLDLNGHVISASTNNSSAYVLVSNGTTTLTDSSKLKTGAISNSSTGNNDCARTVGVAEGASLTVNGAKILSQNGQGLRVDGSLVLNDGAVVKTTGNYSGNYSNGACAIDIRATGSLVVRDGAQVYSENGLNMYVFGGADIIISGGDFHCCTPKGLFGGAGANTVVVTGGSFNYDPSMLVPFGYLVSEQDGIYSVKSADVQYAFVSDLAGLKAAAANATYSNPADITLTSSISISEVVTISEHVSLSINENVTITIDGNGALINNGNIYNEGTIVVTGNGFLSNPSSIMGSGVLEGYTIDGNNYIIENAMDFQWLSYVMYYHDSLNVTLANDITMPEGVVFEQIPGFSGIFDGANHSVYGIVLNAVSSYTGIFRGLAAATIKNVTFNETVNAQTGTTGGVAGYIYGDTFFENVTVSGSITLGGSAYGAAGFVGAVSGENASKNIHFVNCENKASIYAPNASIVGGFYGTASGDPGNQSPAYFINCTNSGNITSGGYAGSIGGFMSYVSTGKSYVYGLTNTGTITGGNTVGKKDDNGVVVLGADGYGQVYSSTEYDCEAGQNGAYVITPKVA